MEYASGVLQQQRGYESALLLRVRALQAMGDLLGAANDLRASKVDHTSELEAMDSHISLVRHKVGPLYPCVAVCTEKWACLAMGDLLGASGDLGACTEADCRQLWRLQSPWIPWHRKVRCSDFHVCSCLHGV